MPVMRRRGITKCCASPTRSFRTAVPWLASSLTSTRLQGAGSFAPSGNPGRHLSGDRPKGNEPVSRRSGQSNGQGEAKETGTSSQAKSAAAVRPAAHSAPLSAFLGLSGSFNAARQSGQPQVVAALSARSMPSTRLKTMLLFFAMMPPCGIARAWRRALTMITC